MYYSIKVSHLYAPAVKIQADKAQTLQELSIKANIIQAKYGKMWTVHTEKKFKSEKVESLL